MLTISSVIHKEWLEDKVSLDYYEFFADEDSDLPTGGEYTPDEPTDITYKIAQGSMGYVISTSTMYLLNSEGSWVEQESSGGGGGGGTINDAKITIQKNGVDVESFTLNQSSDETINITVPTSAADVSALPASTKYAAALSLTINSSTFVVTGQLKDQNGDNLGTAQTIDLPLESVVVNGSYNSQTKKVVLTLQNGNTIEFSVADLVSGLQTELSASNKLNPAYINYDSTHAAVSDTEKSTWSSKQNAIDSSHKLSADLVDDSSSTNKFATQAQLDQIDTNKNNISSEQAKTTGMSEGGSDYITVGGIRVYVSATAPTGARTGDMWIGG